MKFHTVCFDIGGTVVGGESMLLVLAKKLDNDRKNEIFHYLIDAFMEIYLDKNPPRFYTIKDILKMSVTSASEKFGVSMPVDEIVSLYRSHHMTNDYVFEDALPALKKLRENGTKKILVSDADHDVLLEQLKMFDVLKYFDAVIVSSQIEAYKPSDKTVAAILENCDKPYSDILFVGDLIVDIQTAQKIGAKSALINRKGEFKHDADYHIKSLGEILNL